MIILLQTIHIMKLIKNNFKRNPSGVLLVFLFLICSGMLQAQQRQFTSKQIVKQKTFNQGIMQLWNKWTTHEGLKTFFGKDNQIDLQPNGVFEIYFLLDQPVGMRGSEGCKVLSFLPKKYFSFTWNIPPNFSELRKSGYKSWVTVEFDSINEKQTTITLTHFGWTDDEKLNPVIDYFTLAWDKVFSNLSKFDEEIPVATLNKVTGIGGLFFKCDDPKKMTEWYRVHLGLNTNEYGAIFEWRRSENSERKGTTQWSPFSKSTNYFAPSTKDFMINYRVNHLAELVDQLKKDGVKITDSIQTYDYGKFVHIMDPEGNKIELWEPNEIE